MLGQKNKDTTKNKQEIKKAKKLLKDENVEDFVVWAVVDNENPEVPVTFTATHSDAVMALDQYLYLKHYTHFRQWCPLHGLPVDHANSWLRYSEEVIASEYNAGDAPLYTIARITYKPNIIASLLRTYNYCTPLGLPFDTSEEIEEYAKRVEDLPDSELSPIEKALDILIEDIKNDEVAEAAEIKAHCPLYSRPQQNHEEDKKYDA